MADVVESGEKGAQSVVALALGLYLINCLKRYNNNMQRQYAEQQPPPPGRQYAQSGNDAYQQVQMPPNHDGRQQYVHTSAPPQFVTHQQPALVNVTKNAEVPKRGTTTIVRTTNSRELIPTKLEVEGQLIANSILVGFLLVSFQADKVAMGIKEAQILSLQLVAFGCFLSAVMFYGMYLQRRGKWAMRSWVYIANILSMIGLVLLVAAVALSSRIQLGEEYEGIWSVSVSVMIILVVLPIICDIGFCCSQLIQKCLSWIDNLW